MKSRGNGRAVSRSHTPSHNFNVLPHGPRVADSLLALSAQS